MKQDSDILILFADQFYGPLLIELDLDYLGWYLR